MKEILVIGIFISLIIPPIISILFGGADIGKSKEKMIFKNNKIFAINDTKNRVDISLREYEELKTELKEKTELLKKYDEFISDLAENIQQRPEILLKGKVVKSEIERLPYKMSYNLYVVFEFEDRDLGSKGE